MSRRKNRENRENRENAAPDKAEAVSVEGLDDLAVSVEEFDDLEVSVGELLEEIDDLAVIVEDNDGEYEPPAPLIATEPVASDVIDTPRPIDVDFHKLSKSEFIAKYNHDTYMAMSRL